MMLFILYNILSVITISLQASTSCYYPDGTYIAADRPCIGNGVQESFCCGTQGVMCLADKVCHYNDTTPKNGVSYGRGSCTDQSWTSPACPNFCLSAYFWCLVMRVADMDCGEKHQPTSSLECINAVTKQTPTVAHRMARRALANSATSLWALHPAMFL